MKTEPSVPRNVEDVYPLSPLQEGMLFHSLYAPGSGVYVTQLACTLEGLRIAPFKRAWQAMVDRHPILRTGFVWKNTPRLLQVVGRRVGVPVVEEDWRELTAAEQAGQWAEHVRADRHRDFDFGKAPLLRLSLVRVGEETWRMLWTCHHILLDGWCLPLVLREVFVLYQAFCEGKDEGDAGLGAPRPYRDYIGWLERQDGAAAEVFWRRVLEGFAAPTPVELGGVPEGGEERPGYGCERLVLEPAALAAAELLARHHGLTLNTLALGAWALLLGRGLSADDEPEVLFGTVASGRPPELPGVEEIIGPLLNTLPLRVSVDPGRSVLGWLRSIQALQVEMRQYEHTPLADLQKWSAVPAGRPLFDSVLAFESYPRVESAVPHLPGLAVRDVRASEQTHFPLSVSFNPAGGSLTIIVLHERARFERTAVQRLLAHLATLLERMVDGPDLRLGDLSPLSAAERHQLESEWSDTRTARDGGTALRLFEAQADRTPEAVAVVDGERQVTYRELDARTSRLARHLLRRMAGPERLVALCLERSVAMVEGILAAWKAGAACLALDPALPAERLAFLLADSGAPLLLTGSAICPDLPQQGARVLRLDAVAGAIEAESAGRLEEGARAGDLAYLIYTSGTTGRPKAVLVEHASLANVLLACSERFPLPAGGAMPHLASFSFDISLFELFAPLLAGGRSILVARDETLDVPRLAASLADVAAFHAVPSLMRQIVDHLRERGMAAAGPSLVFTGGDAVPPDLLADLREVFPAARIVVLYGPTEGTIVASAWPVPAMDVPARALIGRPLANVELRVVDARLHTVPVGVAGELCLGGAGVARGYLGREELTRERFVELEGRRFYRTGDLARWRPDGVLEILGRSDDQIKIYGFRVEPGEIEAALREHPGIAEAAVLAAGEAGRQLVAFVTAAGEGAPEPAELRAHLGRTLPAYMVPAVFSFLPALPLTPHGKVDRRALASLAGAARRAVERSGTAPRTTDEERLAAIWSEVLRVERVGVHDDFFALGGDSILSIQIVARAQRAGLRLTPRDVFEHPTVAALAALAAVAPAAPQADQGLVTGAVPLTPIQRRFFALGSPEPHHFNLPLLLTVSAGLEPGLLARAVRHLALHHDALRLRFRRGEAGWEQWIAGVEGLPRLVHLDLAALPAERRTPALEAAAADLQASLDLERGPLLRPACFRLAPGDPGRLLLAAHHLVVDGVSWRILLEDLETVCRQLAAGEPVRLPAKTTSFKHWAERLQARGGSTAPRPPAGRPESTMATARTCTVALEEGETRALLAEVPAAYRTRINDVLLAALALAYARWKGETSLLVDLEGHGRREEVPGVDLSRTVGWLTAVDPVRIDLGDSRRDDPGALLKQVKEQLRAPQDAGLPEPEIGFNYLGQLDLALPAGSVFSPARESAGPAVSRRTARHHLLEVNAGVVEGRLRTSWSYSSAVHPPPAIETLAAAFQEALREIIAHCLSPQAGGATPADFPLAALDQESLDRLLGDGPRARRIEDVYPLSPLQQGMLFHALYSPDAGAYVVQRTAELAGELDVAAFRRAWQALVDRHAVLRTGFAWRDLARPLQVVHRGAALPFVSADWSTLPTEESRRRVEEHLAADRRRDFDPQLPPLLRVSLLRTAPGRHRWVWSVHHLLLDGWCMSLLFDELLRLYAAFRAGREIRLPAPRPYRDYIAWLAQQDLAAAETFWRRTLAGLTGPTGLPLAHDPGGLAGAPARRRQERAVVPAGTVAALQVLGRRQQLTLNILVEAAWAFLLARYAGGEREVVFGVTVSGRPAELPGVEAMIGLFINTLPRRVEVLSAEPLPDWLARLQRQHLDLRRHEHAPLSEIQRWSEVPGGRLFESIFSFESYPVDEEVAQRHSTGLEIAGFEGAEDSGYPLDLAVMPGTELALLLAYDGARLPTDVASRMARNLVALLGDLAGSQERRVGDLEVLAPAERRQLLVEWNRTAAPFPVDRCLHELFSARAAATPEAPAVLAPEGELTFGELDRRSNRLAHHLRARGVVPETVVGLCVERSAELAVGLLGILKAGGAYLPLDPSSPSERLAGLLEDARVHLLLTQERLLPQLGRSLEGIQALCLDAAWPAIAEESPAAPVPLTGAGNLAYAIYTSGSTGRPKSALVEHRALVNYSLEMVRQLGLGPGDRFLQFASLAFDVLIEETFPTWLAGGAVVLPGKDLLLSVDALRQVIRERRVTGLELPSAYWQEWVDALAEEGGVPPSLRFVIVGSEKPGAARVATWQGFGVPLIYVFGLTETAITSTLYKLPPGTGEADLDLPIGRPVANTAVYLLDREQRPVPLGVAGELYIGGAGVGRGYLHRPALTAERFVPDPFGDAPGARLYRTGDLARYRSDGNLDFLGRLDHQVKIRGFRVEPGEIEAALRRHPAVRDAVVAVHAGRLAGYVVPHRAAPRRGDGAGELRTHLERRLPGHMIPAVFVFLEALPLTPNGKVDRRALPPPAGERVDPEGHVPPRTVTEEILATIWEEVLGRDRVGAEDDFFALGGDSILSLQVVSRARRAGLHIHPRDLFEHPTVARLARVAAALEESAAEPETGTGPVPLTPIQRWFFDQGFATPHHFNLPLLLEFERPIADTALRRVLVRLLAHHDALRLRFVRSDEAWRQSVAPPAETAPLTTFDLSALAAAEQSTALAEAGAALQASFDLAAGPLLRAALFEGGAERPQRLLLAAHHLTVDTVSWRILAEDLAQGLRQASAGAEIDLPPRTASFRRWAERLAAHALSPAVAAELDFWAAEPRARVARLPIDFPEGDNARHAARDLLAILDAEETRALLQEVPRLSRAQIQEALVAALSLALAGWTGEPLLLIDCEGHGREDLSADLDLSRTVGWLTSIYPALIDLRGTAGAGAALLAVKEQLREIPDRGLGHGLLRHLGPEEARRRLAALPPPQVLFNYVGQLGQGMEGDLPFTLGRDPVGPPQGTGERRTHVLEVNADVFEGRLRMRWSWSADLHRRATIEALSQRMVAAVREILAACRAGEASGPTPSDFPLAACAGLTRAQLDQLIAGRPRIADVYPLAPLQKGMLFDLLDQPQVGLYVGQLACELHGDLDTEAFRAAWQRMVDRHPALRTTFHWEGFPEPLQVVHEGMPLPLEIEDWRELSEAAQRERLARILESERSRGFALSELPLMRLSLARKREGVHQLVWSFLQILFDGWSLPLLFREGLGGSAAVRDVRDVRDYIAWLGRQDLGRAEAFWRRALAGLTAPTPLPAADRPWTGTPAEGRGPARRSLSLGAGLTARLRAFGRGRQLTQNTLVQGAWALLLARASGEPEVTFGVVTAGRPPELAGADRMIGLFINTLPARIAVPSGTPAAAWLSRLQAQAVELRGFEHTSLSDIQRWSGAPAGQRLFSTILSFENYPVDESLREAPGGLVVRGLQVSEQAAFPLSLAVVPREDLRLVASFDRQVYDDATAARLMRQLATLLEGMAADPAAPLGDLPWLGEGERHQLVVEWNDTASRYPAGSLAALFEAQVDRTPGALAVSFADGRLSYRELDERANRVGWFLRRLGVGPDRPVGLCVEPSAALVVALLGILKAGGAYVPLDPSDPAERLAFLIADAGLPVVLTRESLVSRLPRRDGIDIVPLETLAWQGSATEARRPGVRVPAECLAYVTYTSGSTGRPKGIGIPHRAVCRLVQSTNYLPFGPAERLGQISNVSFDAATFEIWGALLHGAALVGIEREVALSPERLAVHLAEHRITVLFLTTALFNQVAQEAPRAFAPLRHLLFGGEAVDPDRVRRVLEQGHAGRLLHVYGPTESTTYATWFPVREVAAGAATVPIGGPLSNTRTYVLDRDQRPVPPGVAGELCLGGDGLARGYVARPELTAETFVPDPFAVLPGERMYRTGDLVRFLPTGSLEFLGRFDFQVKVRGFRIELGEVETGLRRLAGVREAVVTVREDGPGSRQLVGYVVLEEGAPAVRELRDRLRAQLPEHMLPSVLVPIPELPLNPVGKVDRRALPAPESLAGEERSHVAPRTATEAALAAIWSEVLSVAQVGAHDDFFMLGGDSILSIQIVARANQAGIRLTPRQIFELRTIAGLAAVAGSAPEVFADQGLVAGPVPLTPIQRRFFEREQPEPHHANFSLLLEPRLPVAAAALPDLLDRAVRHLCLHHDALRLRFHRDGSGWRQVNAGPEAVAPFSCIDLSALAARPAGRRDAALANALAALQASLDLTAGPLARAVLFILGAGEPGRLLLAVHHLLVDGVSWRILLDDLQSVAGQLARGEEVRLPAKTTSFKGWAERLATHARSGALAGELAHWQAVARRWIAPLPVDSTAGEDSVASERSVTVSLESDETAALLHEAPQAYRTEINDLLLTALARVLAGWTGRSSSRVDLEGHGREELFPGVDLSRTVGWLTSVFPVLLEAVEGGPGEALRAVKEQLRGIPGRGLGDGLLRHLGDDEAAATLRGAPAAEVSFNYLGQLDPAMAGAAAAFAPAHEPAGPAQSPRARREHLLAVGAQVLGGRLRVDWSYSENRHRRETVEGLAQAFLAALRELIAHCTTSGAGAHTPSDFPLARLDQEELDRLLAGLAMELPAIPRYRVVEDIYPATPLQEGMLFHTRIAPSAALYFEQVGAQLLGDLDPAALRQAWQRVVDRHAALRTAFVQRQGAAPVQVVLARVELPWHEEDWRTLPVAEQRARRAAFLAADRERGFQLDRAPLLRLALVRLADAEWQVIWSHHHVLLDAWCRSLVLAEAFALYDGFRAGEEAALPHPRPYRDYIAWLDRQDITAAEAYWRRTLGSFTEPTPLPGAAPRGEVVGAPRVESGRLEIRLGAGGTAELATFCRRQGLTPGTLVQAGWSLLLARSSGEETVVSGAVVAGRPAGLPGVESIVGLLINTLPILAEVPPAAPVLSWLADLQARLIELRQYEHSPLARVQRWSGVPAGVPLFESVLVFQNTPEGPPRQMTDLQIGSIEVAEKTDYPITLVAEPGPDLALRIEFDAERLQAVAARGILERLAVLLQGLSEPAGEHGRTLREVPVLSAAERHQLLQEWGPAPLLPPVEASVPALFAERAARRPDAVAVVCGSRTLTYGELQRRAGLLAHRLRRAGVGPEVRVGLCLERSADLAVGILGILAAGGAYVPLDPAHPRERIDSLLGDSGAALLLTAERLRELEGEGRPVGPPARMPLESAAYVLYTSGSTGRPKGVVVAHRQLASFATDMAGQLALGPDDRVLQFAALGFDVVVEELFPAWVAGAAVVFPDRDLLPSVRELEETVRAQGVTGMELPAPYWHEWVRGLADGGRRAPASLRWVIVGSERPSPEAVATWRKLGPPLLQVFGLTETTVTSSLYRLPAAADEPVPAVLPVGRPIAGASLHVLDRHGELLPAGTAGELCIGGEGLARGYLGRPDLTAERFVPDPWSAGGRLYRTGDRARFRQDGQLEFLGRLDQQLKIRGIRIEPGEIEAELLRIPGVREAVVAARNGEAGRRLMAWIVPDAAVPPVEELSRALRKRLPEAFVPASFVVLERLPLLSNGKLDRRALPAPEEPRREAAALPRSPLEGVIAAAWREVLGTGVGIEDNFFAVGGDSLLLLRLCGRLETLLGREVSIIEMFRHPTVASQARLLGDSPAGDAPVLARSAARAAARRPRSPEIDAVASKEAIAIIGLAGRFPGAPTLEDFWRNLRGGVESVSFFTDEELLASGVPSSLVANPSYIRARGVLAQIEQLDAGFFGFTPNEAALLDPQHRVFLECAWEALESAGCDPERAAARIAVYAGCGESSYIVHHLLPQRELLQAMGGLQVTLLNDRDFLPLQTSYRFNLTGVSTLVQSTCSTSLLAVHLACQALLAGECDVALAGGVSIGLPQAAGYLYQPGGVFSSDGHCRAFDAAADGSLSGSGAGVVVLKPLSAALADGDPIRAVIRGTAAGNDGAARMGFTAPGVEGQMAVIAESLAVAGVSPDTIGYVEAHGSGTQLGDPIEVSALTGVFRAGTPRRGFCALGSVKTNLGHLDEAAGAAGLLKTVLALEHAEIPPSLHFRQPNPRIDFADSPFYVNAELSSWPAGPEPRRAGVSSFGLGGTNVHVVLEQAPPAPAPPPSGGPHLLVLSAKTPSALDAMAARLADHLEACPDLDLADAAHTLQVGRRAFRHRRAVVCRDRDEAMTRLRGVDPAGVRGEAAASAPQVAFLLPGLGEHAAGMARRLYASEPLLRREIDRCCELLAPALGLDLRRLLLETGKRDGETPAADPRNDLRALLRRQGAEEGAPDQRTLTAQPAVFVVEVALARLLLHWGIRPQAMIGYSVGEYVAAVLAGVMRLEDALRLIAVRAALIDALPPGAMLAVPLDAEALAPLLGEASLAAVDGPHLSVAAGTPAAIERLEQELAARGVACLRLAAGHAFHSPLMDPAAERFREIVAGIELRPPAIPFLSNLTGTWITAAEATDPSYWMEQMRRTVRFWPGLGALLESGSTLLVEVGPGTSLSTLARQHPLATAAHAVVPVLPRPAALPGREHLLAALGRLWVAGAGVDWDAVRGDEPRRRVPLPTYPFERQRHWIEPPRRGGTPAAATGPVPPVPRAEIRDWFWAPAWSEDPCVPAPAGSPDERWLLFADRHGLALRLAARLREEGRSVVTVEAGTSFQDLGDGRYAIEPRRSEDHAELLRRLAERGGLPDQVLHLWTVAAEPPGDPTPASFEHWQDRGLHSLLRFVQALGDQPRDRPLGLLVVSTWLQAVVDGEPTAPEKATLLAAGRVIPQEIEGVSCRSLDIVLPPSGSPQEEALIGRLLAEARHVGGEEEVALRGRGRWVRRGRPVPLDSRPGRPVRLREGGIYLITEGVEGLGLALAEALAGIAGARLALTTSRPFPPFGGEESRLQALRDAGTDLLVIPAETADADRMRSVLALVQERFGCLHGVIHAPRPAAEGLIQLHAPESLAGLHGEHALGGLVLAGLLVQEPLDFLVLCASLTGQIGGVGQVDGCASGAFLGALAQREAAVGRTCLALEWGPFAWDGAAGAGELAARRQRDLQETGITAAECREVFARALESSLPRLAVSVRDLAVEIERARRVTATSALEELSQGRRAGPAHARPQLTAPRVAPRSEVEQALVGLWEELFGIAGLGIRDSFFELGGHSLLSIQVMTLVRQRFGLELPMTTLFETPTIEELARRIEAAREEDEGADDDLDMTDLLREVQALSPEEVRLRLAQELGEPGDGPVEAP